jgi:hypothetical protein
VYNLKKEDLFRNTKTHDILNENRSVQGGKIANFSNSNQGFKTEQEDLTISKVLQHDSLGICYKSPPKSVIE